MYIIGDVYQSIGHCLIPLDAWTQLVNIYLPVHNSSCEETTITVGSVGSLKYENSDQIILTKAAKFITQDIQSIQNMNAFSQKPDYLRDTVFLIIQ